MTADPRLEAVRALVGRVEGAACRLAGLATRGAVAGGVAGAVLWWVIAGTRVDEWWRGTAGSLLVLALCLAVPAWLLNVRFALHDLVELPGRLAGVTTRRTAGFRDAPRPDGGSLATLKAVREVVGDYGDVVGSWATIAQLVAPTFWLLTVVALAAVPILVVAGAVAGLVALNS
jgi:hypothetical protein